MLIESYGHAKFVLTTASGVRVVTDPFDSATGYPIPELSAEYCLVSHHHHDHDAVDTISGHPTVIDQSGTWQLSPQLNVTALEACHDEQGGRLRGRTLLFVIEMDGLRILHLGDLGHLPDRELADRLGYADALLIPVGGHYTIDAIQAREICTMLRARIVIPMHYRTAYNADWPIAPVDDFLALFSDKAEELNLLRITKEDLSCQPHLAVLRPRF